VGLDGGVLHLHVSWWGLRLLLLGWWGGRGGHHDGAGVGALLLLLLRRRLVLRRLRCDWWEGAVAWAGVVDECYAEHLGLASWGWWSRLLHLLEAWSTDGLRWWRWRWRRLCWDFRLRD
jgi:hypothetical protein